MRAREERRNFIVMGWYEFVGFWLRGEVRVVAFVKL